jgi:hypothetical protein
MYKFEPKKRVKAVLGETDSEDDENETVSATTTGSVTVEEANDPLNDTHEGEDEASQAYDTVVDTVVVPVRDHNYVMCDWCEKFFKKGGIKRHQKYCPRKPTE